MQIQTPKYIQDVLDKLFPGVRLRYNAIGGFWVVTDTIFWPNGLPAWQARMTPTMSLRGSITEMPTDEVVLFTYWFPEKNEHMEIVSDGIRAIPSLDMLINTLRRSYTGAKEHEIDSVVDELEDQEDRETLSHEREMECMRKDAWRAAQHRARGRVISSRFGYIDERLIERQIAKQLQAELQEENAQAADEEVHARMMEGEGISNVPRDRSQMMEALSRG